MRLLLALLVLFLSTVVGPASAAECRPRDHAKLTEALRLMTEQLGLLKKSVPRTWGNLADLRNGMDQFRDLSWLDCHASELTTSERLILQELDAKAKEAIAIMDLAISAEERIRTSVVLPLCEATWGAEQAQAVIEQERKNPSGVVDLQVLHDAGLALQHWRTVIAALKPQYRTLRGTPFTTWQSEAGCVAESQEPQ
jgi:hypothetical protein